MMFRVETFRAGLTFDTQFHLQRPTDLGPPSSPRPGGLLSPSPDRWPSRHGHGHLTFALDPSRPLPQLDWRTHPGRPRHRRAAGPGSVAMIPWSSPPGWPPASRTPRRGRPRWTASSPQNCGTKQNATSLRPSRPWTPKTHPTSPCPSPAAPPLQGPGIGLPPVPGRTRCRPSRIHTWTSRVNHRALEHLTPSLPKVVSDRQGRYRARCMPLMVTTCRTLTWHAFGDPATIQEILSDVRAIGSAPRARAAS